MGVFELAEAELRVRLGSVGGHDVADRPVVLIGDQYSLAEYFRFQCAAGVVVDGEGESVRGRGCAGQLPGQDTADTSRG